jgi:hypothetical protein
MSVLLWGFTSGDLKTVASRLRREHKDWLWVGKGKEPDLPIVAFQEFDIDRLTKEFHVSHADAPVRLSSAERQDCYAVMQREFYAADMEHIDLRDTLHFFECYFSALLRSRAIGTVVFSMVPHLGPELILLQVAKHLGLQTRMFYQSLFAERFIDVSEPAALGELSITQPGPWPVWDEYFTFGTPEQNLFYMVNIPPLLPRWRWVSGLLRGRLKKWLRRKAKDSGLSSVAAQDLQRRRYIQYVDAHPWDSESAFSGKPYVYFPLHLQPELTTDPLGGRYGDQALAIETLRSWLPADVAIVIKENPKQHHEWRDPGFYERLRSLENVFLVDKRVNTYKLLRNSLMAATITGTVGWESVLMGKPVVVFGAAWYAPLPGAFRFAPSLDYVEVTAFRPDFDKLKMALDVLSTHMPCGVVDLHYLPICPAYSQETNEQRLREALDVRS